MTIHEKLIINPVWNNSRTKRGVKGIVKLLIMEVRKNLTFVFPGFMMMSFPTDWGWLPQCILGGILKYGFIKLFIRKT